MNEDLKTRFLAYMAADRGRSPHTLRVYGDTLREVEAYFTALDEGITWQTLDKDVIRRWMAERIEGGLKPRSIKNHLSALRSFYKYLHLIGAVDKNPMLLLENPKTDKPLPTFLKESEMNRLFDNVDFGSDFNAHRDRLILLTFYTTGIRLSELIGLRLSDIHLASGDLKVLGKRNKERIVPFGDELRREMSAYIDLRHAEHGPGDGPLFPGKGGRPLTANQVRRIVQQNLARVTQQKKKSPHVLRHTFATVMMNHGADLEAVRRLLGHESLATTQIYTHTTFAELKKEYQNAHPRA